MFHCCRSDVWDDNELECSLWTAKLFPLYSEKPDGSIFGWDVDGKAIVLKFDSIYWMGDLLNSRSTKATNMWKGLKRKSLSDMLLEGSAAKMLSWRTWMKSVWLSRHNGYHWSWKVSDSLHQRWLGLTSAFTRIDVAAFVAILFSSGIIVDCTILCSKIIDLVAPLIQVRADHIREELEQKQPALVNFIDQAGDNCLSLLVPYWVSYLGKSVSLAIAHTAMSADALLGIPSKSLPRLLLWASVILENCGYLMHNHVQEEIEFRNWQGIISEKLSVEAQLQRYGEKAVECSSSLLSSSAARSGSYGAERLQLFAQMLILSFIEVSNKFAVDSVLQGFRFSRFRGANGRYSLALAPARIDMAGGWSDTPPICFDIGGAVLNVAVMIDGKKPIRCMVRCIEGDAAIRLISYGRVSNGDISSLATEECCSYLDFMDLSHSSSPFALVRACIVALGVVDPSGTRLVALQSI